MIVLPVFLPTHRSKLNAASQTHQFGLWLPNGMPHGYRELVSRLPGYGQRPTVLPCDGLQPRCLGVFPR